MKKLHCLVGLFAATLVLASCGGKHEKKSYDELGESGLTTRTENLAANLFSRAGNGVMVGQLNATIQGVGWTADSARSDINSICGEGPAATGYELSGIEKGSAVNSDSISFDAIRTDLLEMFRRGGLITMTWTLPADAKTPETMKQYVEKMAKYFDTLQNDYGIKAPVLLYPMPLDGKSWYTRLPASEYMDLFHKMAEYIKDANVTNVILGYSTDGDLDRCPVDDISAIELRSFLADADSAQFDSQVAQVLPKVVSYAQEHMKAVGLTTGLYGCSSKTFFSSHIQPIVQNTRLSYLMFGKNYGEPHEGKYCIPYPGMDNEVISDFVMLYNDKSTVFIRHLNGLYLTFRSE